MVNGQIKHTHIERQVLFHRKDDNVFAVEEFGRTQTQRQRLNFKRYTHTKLNGSSESNDAKYRRKRYTKKRRRARKDVNEIKETHPSNDQKFIATQSKWFFFSADHRRFLLDKLFLNFSVHAVEIIVLMNC